MTEEDISEEFRLTKIKESKYPKFFRTKNERILHLLKWKFVLVKNQTLELEARGLLSSLGIKALKISKTPLVGPLLL